MEGVNYRHVACGAALGIGVYALLPKSWSQEKNLFTSSLVAAVATLALSRLQAPPRPRLEEANDEVMLVLYLTKYSEWAERAKSDVQTAEVIEEMNSWGLPLTESGEIQAALADARKEVENRLEKLINQERELGDSQRLSLKEADAKLCQMLTKKDHALERVPGDGACLFHACALQVEMDADTLRKEVNDYLAKDPGMRGYAAAELGGSGNRALQQYCDKMRDPSAWGGEAELIGIVNVIHRSVTVFTSSEYMPDSLTDKRICKCYRPEKPPYHKPIEIALMRSENHYYIVKENGVG